MAAMKASKFLVTYQRMAIFAVRQQQTRASQQAEEMHRTRNDLFERLCEEAKVAPKLGVIGSGNMSRALLDGLLQSGLVPPEAVGVSDVSHEALKALKDNHPNIRRMTNSTKELVKEYGDGVLLLAVKPDALRTVGKQIGDDLLKLGLVISILAGTTTEAIQSMLHGRPPVVRVMPNTAAAVGESATALSLSDNCTDGQTQLVKTMMNTVGTCQVVPEHLMDAVCGLSGSGPAYIYTTIEAMADGAVKCGLPRNIAVALASQTALGAAKMVLQSEKHVAALRSDVCSPKGTTICGVAELEQGAVRAAFMNAVESATQRSKDIGAGK